MFLFRAIHGSRPFVPAGVQVPGLEAHTRHVRELKQILKLIQQQSQSLLLHHAAGKKGQAEQAAPSSQQRERAAADLGEAEAVPCAIAEQGGQAAAAAASEVVPAVGGACLTAFTELNRRRPR